MMFCPNALINVELQKHIKERAALFDVRVYVIVAL
jgi:hypothetical protein